MAKATGGDVLVRLRSEVGELKQAFAGMSTSVASVRETTHDLAAVVVRLHGDVSRLEGNVGRAEGHVSQLAVLLAQYAETTKDRLDDHEARIAALERS